MEQVQSNSQRVPFRPTQETLEESLSAGALLGSSEDNLPFLTYSNSRSWRTNYTRSGEGGRIPDLI
jgi:hypothetical protein